MLCFQIHLGYVHESYAQTLLLRSDLNVAKTSSGQEGQAGYARVAQREALQNRMKTEVSLLLVSTCHYPTVIPIPVTVLDLPPRRSHWPVHRDTPLKIGTKRRKLQA